MDPRTPKSLLEEEFKSIGLDADKVIGSMGLGKDEGDGKVVTPTDKSKDDSLEEGRRVGRGNKLKRTGAQVNIQKRLGRIFYKRNKSTLKRKHKQWLKKSGAKRYFAFMKTHKNQVDSVHKAGRRVSVRAESTNGIADSIYSRLRESTEAKADTRSLMAMESFAAGAGVVLKLVNRYIGMEDESAVDALLTLGEKFNESFELVERGGDAVLTEDFDASMKSGFRALMDAVRFYQDNHAVVSPEELAGF